MRETTAIGAVALLLATCAPAARAASAPYFTPLAPSGSTQLQTARSQAAAAPLPDGRVLIAGGLNGAVLQSAELFDPRTDAFTALPASGSSELQTPRYGSVAAPLPDGKVLIAGGSSTGSDYLATAELFDPATRTFAPVPSQLHTPRDIAVAAPLPDGKVLVAGGFNAASGDLRSAELFDPATDTFTALPAAGATELQTAREGAVAAPLPDGKVLIAGGASGGHVIASAELFDPASETFTALPSALNAARLYAAAVPLPDGKVLVAGGASGTTKFATAELFDPASETFTALPASTELTTARNVEMAAPMPDGRALIVGGRDSANYLKSAELYEPAPEAELVGGDFGSQPAGQPSAVDNVLVANLGAQALTISSASIAGADASDFAVVDDSCAGRRLAFGQRCAVSLRFTPGGAGARSASLVLADNEPVASSLALSGTGVPAPSGGPAGPPGPAGQPGPQGPPGQIELVVCRTVTRTVKVHGHKRTRHVQRCTTRLVSGRVTFTTTTRARVAITRGGVRYASGTAVRGELLVHAHRRLRPGRYTLTIARRRGERLLVEREAIAVP